MGIGRATVPIIVSRIDMEVADVAVMIVMAVAAVDAITSERDHRFVATAAEVVIIAVIARPLVAATRHLLSVVVAIQAIWIAIRIAQDLEAAIPVKVAPLIISNHLRFQQVINNMLHLLLMLRLRCPVMRTILTTRINIHHPLNINNHRVIKMF